jgi:hypothetical protein
LHGITFPNNLIVFWGAGWVEIITTSSSAIEGEGAGEEVREEIGVATTEGGETEEGGTYFAGSLEVCEICGGEGAG